MKLLLDTHAFLWSIADRSRLSPRATRLIESVRNDVFVSTASVWEITIKTSMGRLSFDEPAHRLIPRQLQEARFEVLPVRLGHALGVSSLPLHHADPFDRLLVSQAIAEDLRLVTHDRLIASYDVVVEW